MVNQYLLPGKVTKGDQLTKNKIPANSRDFLFANISTEKRQVLN